MADARESREEGVIPAVHMLQLVEIVARWGVTREELLEDLDPKVLEDPAARLSVPVLERIAQRAYALTGEPALGVYVGLQMRASAHGYLGFAAMTASNIREALELVMKFAPTRTTALGLRLHVDSGLGALVIEERIPLGAAREMILLALMVGFRQMGLALTGAPLEGSADVTFSRPPTFERFDALLGEVRFDQPVNQLVFPASELERPIVLADPIATRLAQEQCERELDALGRAHQETLLARVRSLMTKNEGGFRSLEEVAPLAGMSARTLKRRLAAVGTTFSALVEEEQRERALVLLRSADLSIDAIAARVGYSDIANFTRAFRRWTGTTPAAYRRRHPS